MDNHSKKILIIEDDQLLRDVYIELLTDEGFQIDYAVDGQEGLDKILKGGFDLILLDIVLPKLSGLDVLREIEAQHAESKNGPVVILTNLAEDEKIQRALKGAAAGYIIKSKLTLPEKLQEILSYLDKPQKEQLTVDN